LWFLYYGHKCFVHEPWNFTSKHKITAVSWSLGRKDIRIVCTVEATMLELPWRKVLARAFASSRYEGQELAGIITSIIDKDVYGSPLVKSLQRLDSMSRLSPRRISIQKCEKCSANIHRRTAEKESHRFKKSIHISLLGHISATNQSRSPKIFNLHTNHDPLKSGSKWQNVSAWLHNWQP
jgi:hypothetical protein